MAPPKNLVIAVCVILAMPLSYAAYQLWSLLAAAVVLVVVGVLVPQAYARLAVPAADVE